MSINSSEFIVTIDGPAGSGKSTAAKRLAEKIGFDYLDTGAMYRCSALAGIKAKVDWAKPELLEAVVARSSISNQKGQTFLNGEDVSDEIRTPEVTQLTRYAANNPEIRRLMTNLQRLSVTGRQVVTEGRDQGTAAFPHADCKFYLTASPEVRARRRMEEMKSRGESVNYDEILASINRRDEGDINRTVGPLRKPENAIEIDTDEITPGEVVSKMAQIIIDKLQRK